MSSDETRGDMADQAEISIMAAERAAIEAVRAARRRRLEESTDDHPSAGSDRPAGAPTHDVGTTST
jgi:hypothetical protein